MDTSKLVKVAGILGVALAGFGIFAIWRQSQLQRLRGLGDGGPKYRQVFGTVPEASMIDSYSDGDMMTELRSDPNMTIEQRLASIQKLVYKSVQDPQMRKLALAITRHCPDRDGMCEAKAIFKAVKKRVRYNGDIAPIKHPDGSVDGIDLYQHAKRTWELQGGDCDDQVILISTLLALNGITPKLRVTSEEVGGEPGHIYPVGLLPKFAPEYAVALDTTLPGHKFNVEAPAAEIMDFDA